MMVFLGAEQTRCVCLKESRIWHTYTYLTRQHPRTEKVMAGWKTYFFLFSSKVRSLQMASMLGCPYIFLGQYCHKHKRFPPPMKNKKKIRPRISFSHFFFWRAFCSSFFSTPQKPPEWQAPNFFGGSKISMSRQKMRSYQTQNF